MMLTVGDLLDDRYRLVERIATGGMGDVWQAADEMVGRTVAVKSLHARLIDDAGIGERFRGEARAMAALRHSGVAAVYDYGETTLPDGQDIAYIVMACVRGQPLSARIALAGRLDPTETMSIVAQSARALQAVHHAGVVHRDVKPGNLIVEPNGHVVLVDFGVALTVGAAGMTDADEVVGTALYMAPEQVSKDEITQAADVYALGAVAYHCLAGRPPFIDGNALTVAMRHVEDDPPPLPDDVPAACRKLVATAMAKDPARRFPTASDMADAAQAVYESSDPQRTVALAAIGSPPARPIIPRPAPARGGARRWRTAAVAVLACLAALAAILVVADPVGLMPGPSDRPSAPSPGNVRPGRGGPTASPVGGVGGAQIATTGPTGLPRPTGNAAVSGTPRPAAGDRSGGQPQRTGSATATQGPTARSTPSATADATPTPTPASTTQRAAPDPRRSPMAKRHPECRPRHPAADRRSRIHTRRRAWSVPTRVTGASMAGPRRKRRPAGSRRRPTLHWR